MDLYPGTHIRWLISGGLYPRANIGGAYIRGLCPGGLNSGQLGAYIKGHISGELISGVIYPGAYIQ